VSISLVCALVALAATLIAAVARPRGLPEALFAIPLAAILIAAGIEPWSDARSSARSLGPTLAFLALILVLGHLCAEAGVFDYLGGLAAAASSGQATRLLIVVVGLAALVTATLTLDATVVLLTPVVLRAAHQVRARSLPHSYACIQVANSGSLLLPISNLTNLLAFSASGLSFGRFALLMALPWTLATVLEWAGLRWFFRDLLGSTDDSADHPATTRGPALRYALAVSGLTVAGFVTASSLQVAPAWAALGGVVLLGLPALRTRHTSPVALIRSANLGFVVFVLALGVIVDAISRHGVGSALSRVIPSGTSLPALLAIAFIAALVANLANNLPATLALVPVVAGHPAAVLAVLLGVNIGPNLTYAGSLATLLWRRLVPADARGSAGQFHRYGLLSVPVILATTTCALWLVA
jgi:arsenical pump membrane protein